MTIITERLRLRLPQMSDLQDIHQIFCDEAVMTYWSSPAHKSHAETAQWLAPILADPVGSQFDYFLEFEGRLIGKLGCWRVPEIGFVLARPYWGRGFAQEALRAFIPYIRSQNVCDHLWADVDPRNLRSKALLEKCGFLRVGSEKNTFKTHIGWCDSDYYRLPL